MTTLLGEADFAGDGTVTGIGVVLKQGEADLTGSAILASNGNFQVFADLVGSASTSSTGDVVFATAADLSGDGQLGSTSTVLLAGEADFAGNGLLGSDATAAWSGAADLAGDAVIAAVGLDVNQGAVDVVGSGTIGASATVLYGGASADLKGSGTVVGVLNRRDFDLIAFLIRLAFANRARIAFERSQRSNEIRRLAKTPPRPRHTIVVRDDKTIVRPRVGARGSVVR